MRLRACRVTEAEKDSRGGGGDKGLSEMNILAWLGSATGGTNGFKFRER